MITRITGIAALVGLVAVAGYGVLLAVRRGHHRARIKRRLHRRLSRLVLVVLGVHIGAALLDRRHVPPDAVLVPFISPVRTVAAGLGSLALWGVILVMITVVARRWFRRSWRVVHYLAYPATGFALAHSLLGSDPILTASLTALCVAVVIAGSMWPRRRLTRPKGSTLPLLSSLAIGGSVATMSLAPASQVDAHPMAPPAAVKNVVRQGAHQQEQAVTR